MSTDAQGFPLRDVFVATANLPPMHIQLTKLAKAKSLLVSLHRKNNWVIQLSTWSQTHNERIFSPPPSPPTPPPPRNSTLQPSVVKWCCPHQRRAMCKKTENTHECINNKCQYLTAMEASFSRWLLIILLTQSYRRPAGVGFGLVYSGSRTQKPQNITSRNKFGKCIPFHGS